MFATLDHTANDKGWPEPYIYAVYDRVYDDISAKNTGIHMVLEKSYKISDLVRELVVPDLNWRSEALLFCLTCKLFWGLLFDCDFATINHTANSLNLRSRSPLFFIPVLCL